MCEINPKHSMYLRLEAFTSNPEMSREEFERKVIQKLLDMETKLNEDGNFRFHIHELEQ